MIRHRACVLVLMLILAAPLLALAAGTVTFTGEEPGTFPGTLQVNRESGVLTVDLAAIPGSATVFRAELVLRERDQFDPPNYRPTVVYPVGKPEAKLPWVGPRFVSLDALAAVREAIAAGRPLELKLENTLRGVLRLEVSYLEAEVPGAKTGPVAEVKAVHRRGQTFLTFREPHAEAIPEFAGGRDVAEYRARWMKEHPGATFRIWRSPAPITPATIGQARLVGECGPMSGWNDTYHQDRTDDSPPVRYRVIDGGEPLPWGVGVYVHSPDSPGRAYYAVTLAAFGQEDFNTFARGGAVSAAVEETVGPGEPVLQWVERPDPNEGWLYRRGQIARLIYTRWEAWPRASTPNRPIDYLVAIPLRPAPEGEVREAESQAFRAAGPAPVGLHLHCWGGSLNDGYGWWYNAHRGAVLIASNQIPYDWWTGYHESRGTRKTLGDGVVRPFSTDRMIGFLDWAARQSSEAPEQVRPFWPPLDLTRVFTAGNSMGGSGVPMFAIRHGDRIAWGLGWVGVHVPERSPQFKGSYEQCYGPRNDAVTMPDRKTSPWDWFSDAWWLREHVGAETGFVAASNGRNDGAIGWPQAVEFARALQETRRPHMFNWGMGGHGTRTLIGSNFPWDIRTDQTLPAFTRCSLDDDLGNGDPGSGKPEGQFNAFLSWETDDVIDAPDRWAMTVSLVERAPADECRVDLTPRRSQQFKLRPGGRVAWTNTPAGREQPIASGEVAADAWGLVTIPQLAVGKGANRVEIVKN